MSLLNNKSPITYLFELCFKRGLTPVFELEENGSGSAHQQTFDMKVTAGEFVGKGVGTSKKKAKHLAALDAVNQILGKVGEVEALSVVIEQQNLGVSLQSNPVSELQELTQKRLLPLPTYEFEMTSGPPHVREFTCTVHLLQLNATGTGKSKKAAKHSAASVLLDQLKVGDLSETLDNALKCLKDEFNISQSDIRMAYQTLQKNRKLYSQSASNGVHGPSNLQQVKSCCDLLQELANQYKFEVTYVDLPELTCAGYHQCVVQLSTMPVAVCHGLGLSKDKAHINAAFNTLAYIQNAYSI